MWEWIHAHRDDLQALGPVATIFAAIIAVVVTGTLGFAQWRIARAQKDIAYDKLKLDLFERRYAVYRASWDICVAFMNEEIEVDVLGEWRNTLSESQFLFPKGVIDLTRSIWKECFDWEQNYELLKHNKIDEEERNRTREWQKKIIKTMGNLRLQIDSTFDPELGFKQLTRKK